MTRVLDDAPEPFAPANREKREALRHFQPYGVLVSRCEVREQRRAINESVLDSGRPLHRQAAAITRDFFAGMSRSRPRVRPRGEGDHDGSHDTEENTMAKYLMLKHYRGAPAAVNNVPMAEWTPEEIAAHIRYMDDFAARLEETGEYVDGQALSPEGTWVRFDGEGRPPVTDGPFAETKDLIAGWMIIDVDSRERALELAGELSAAPGAGGEPIHEWLELRPFMGTAPTISE